MAFAFQRDEISLHDTSHEVIVSDNPVAKLMYYLDCMCNALELGNVEGLERLRDHRRHHLLMHSEKQALVNLCRQLHPSVLDGKVIFHSEALCGTMQNKFFSLSVARQTLAATQSIVVAGQVRAVKKIMTYKMIWLRENYYEPMNELQNPSLQKRKGKQKCICKCIKIVALVLLFPIICPLYCIYWCFCKDK